MPQLSKASPAPTGELGAVFLEYALMISLVAAVVAGALLLFGPAVAGLIGDPALLDWLLP